MMSDVATYCSLHLTAQYYIVHGITSTLTITFIYFCLNVPSHSRPTLPWWWSSKAQLQTTKLLSLPLPHSCSHEKPGLWTDTKSSPALQCSNWSTWVTQAVIFGSKDTFKHTWRFLTMSSWYQPCILNVWLLVSHIQMYWCNSGYTISASLGCFCVLI